MKPVYLYCLDFPNGKIYIGLSNNPAKRLQAHLAHAAASRLRNRIHNAILKHGRPDLRTLCVGNKEYIAELEIKAIAAFQTRDIKFGYNVSLGGELSPSLVPELAARAGATKQGRRFSAEHRAKISAAHIGMTHTPETRAKLSAASKGNTNMVGRSLSRETRAKISAKAKGRISPMQGKQHSLEALAKMSAAHRGNSYNKGRTLPPEVRAKISATKKGKPGHRRSPESIAKSAAAHRGMKRSAETRAKLRAAWQLRRLRKHSRLFQNK